MDNFEKLRKAGRVEQYSTARNHLGFYNNVAVAATYTLPNSFSLPVEDYVYKTCEILIGQHPILSAIPRGEDTNEAYWVRLPEVDFSQVVHFGQRTDALAETDEYDAELDGLLQKQHNTPLIAPHPYWRLIVLTESATEARRFTAVFVYHHAIGDGTSGKAFHQTFLKALQTTTSLAPGEAKQTITSPKSPLLPTLEEAHSLPLSFLYVAGVLFREKIWSPRNPGLWTGSEVRLPLATQLKHVAFSESVSSTFRKVCRQNNTTITATLGTVIARALLKHLPAHFTQVKSSIPISMRKWLSDPITDDSMGVWVADVTDTYDRSVVAQESSPFPWSEARRSRATLEKTLKGQGKDMSSSLLKYVDDTHEYFKSKVGKPRGASFELSNVGALVSTQPSEAAAAPQMGRVVFSQCASVTGSAFETSIVTGGDGCMVVTFSWQEDVVGKELVLAVLEAVKTEVLGLCAA